MSAPVMRYKVGDYLGVTSGSTTTYEFMGTGFKNIDESPNAQTDSVTYVNDKGSSVNIVGYETEFPFTADSIMSEAAIEALWAVGRDHLIGDEAVFDYIRVDLWEPTETSNVFPARKFKVSAEISDWSGEGGQKQEVSGTLHAIGDPVIGTFNTSTKAFTETT